MFDCQKIADYMSVNGWSLTKKASSADIVIINTCSFNAQEDESSADLLRYYLARKKPAAKMIVAGCLPVINPDLLKGIGEFSCVVPTHLDRLDEFIEAAVPFGKIKEPDAISPQAVSYRPLLKIMLQRKKAFRRFINEFEFSSKFLKKSATSLKDGIQFLRYLSQIINPFIVCRLDNFKYLRVSKGCLGACSYCAKKFATGRLSSKPLVEIAEEFMSGLQSGAKMFYLISEDLGCYGLDRGTTIPELLQRLLEAGRDHDFKLVLTNFNPHWFIEYFDRLIILFKNNQKKILYLHIPLQSGSDRILASMKRPYRREEVERCLLWLRREAPNLALTTDIIVGFPGEEKEDFDQTKDLINSVRFEHVDVFTYADREGTPSSLMQRKVYRDIIKERRFELLKSQKQNARRALVLKKAIEISKNCIA